MILKKIETLLQTTLREVIKRKHEYILLEHILYEICQHKKGINFFKTEATLTEIKARLDEYLHNEIAANLGADEEPLTSIMVERVINRAIKNSMQANKNSCDLSDILQSMLEEEDSFARNLLLQEVKNNTTNFSFLATTFTNAKFNFGSFKTEVEDSYEDVYPDYIEKDASLQPVEDEPDSSLNPLPNILIDLKEKVFSNQHDFLVGRKKEIEKINLVLARRKKNNPILLGEPGIGKTSIVKEMAFRIHSGHIPSFLNQSKIFFLDYNALLVGTKFRGELEERCRVIFNFFKENFNYILFLDDLHFILNGNSNNAQNSEFINLIRSFISNEKVKCIATINANEYTNLYNKEMSLFRLFEPISILETSLEETEAILLKIKAKYEAYHQVHFPHPTIKRIVDLTKEYFPEKKLPDGAIDLLDYCGAWVRLDHEKNKAKKEGKDKLRAITIGEVENNVSLMKEIKVKKISLDQKDFYLNLEKKLSANIFGQDQAIRILLENLKLSQTGLLGKDNILGSFLFTGPTGVGKTELTKILAEAMSLNLIRLDMSEFMEAHSVAKIIGAPPGYIGFNERKNELSERLKLNPFSLILLDEIEKAHPDVVNIFLQIMDYGKLTDSAGNPVNCKNSLVIMTSNLGAREMTAHPLGFGESDFKQKNKEAVNTFFSPEFRNRLTGIVQFNPLDKEVAKKIVIKLLAELNELLKNKSIKVEFKNSVIRQLISLGFDKKMGARPIKRVIEKEIKSKLINGILDKTIREASKVTFDFINQKIIYKNEKIN